ncbi:hypothetical protein [Pontibacter korlensis]|uniref:hypothetical protein n=1 Tax=Pontibacter korlensis TaxID=400092 RepID=UPI00130DB4E0|nr:hypothetical protein [Pontibacter korlensis]
MYVIDDGSFTEKNVKQILQLSPSVRVISRKEREDFVLEKIGNRPNCKKYREDFPLSFKLLDIPLIASKESPRYTFTDSDIIYLKNCQRYFNQQENTYLKTDSIKLSVKLRNGLLKYKWAIPVRFNSGYFSYDTRNFDLDFIEYYLGLSDVRNSPWLSEQTCWALLFGKSGPSYCPSEVQFICQENCSGPKASTLAVHLIGGLKGKVHEWSIQEEQISLTSINPIFESSRNVTLVDWAQKSAKRILRAVS